MSIRGFGNILCGGLCQAVTGGTLFRQLFREGVRVFLDHKQRTAARAADDALPFGSPHAGVLLSALAN